MYTTYNLSRCSFIIKIKVLRPETLMLTILLFNKLNENETTLNVYRVRGLLIVRSIMALIWMMWTRHLALRGGTLHAWRWWPSWSRPHTRTKPSWLVKRGAESTLVLGELLHGGGVIVMWRRGINRGSTVLRWRSWGWVVNVRGHLTYDVPWWGGDRWGSCGHRGRRGLVVHQVWRPGGLSKMLHGVTDGWGRGRRGAKVMLWRPHHVMRM